jgi:hypothetical protein
MPKLRVRIMLGVLAGGLLLAGREARAQVPVGPTAMAPGNGALLNPLMNPYANPYLNPSLTMSSTSRNDALLYLYTAQQQPGGLLGGPAFPPGGSGAKKSGAAEMPRSAMQPGGGASKYFNRGSLAAQSTVPSGSRYGRSNRYFSHNGK